MPPAFIAEAYLHTLDPFAVQFTEQFGLRWYGLAYAAGFLIGWWILRLFARTGRTSLSVADVGDYLFYLIAGVLIGGRVGYALFYDPALFIGFTSTVPFWDLLAINKGGMASHGGMIGVIGAAIIFARRREASALHLLDLVSFVCPTGLFLGRMANFVNGELHGRAIPDQANPPWWSMKFPQELHEWPVEQLTRLSDVVTSTLSLTRGEWEQLVASAATDDRAYATVRGTVSQLIRLAQEGNELVREGMRPVLTAYYPSQLIQALTDGPLLLAVIAIAWWKPRRPGVVGSWFLIAYGVMRIASERWREPDVGVEVWMGLSRGQILSVLLVVAGFVALPLCVRRKVAPMGGLGGVVSPVAKTERPRA